MDIRLLASTFAAVFLAELGDKTQLATMSLASANASRWTIFVASASALVASSALAVLVGEAVAKAIPPVWIKRGAGALFIVLGAIMVWQSFSKTPEPDKTEAAAES
jgi:putative Ca2+/H+ antiporter (TMEM165/GDT1 family)